MAAARLLNWDRLDAYISDSGDETDYRIFEIEENLRRQELTEQEKDKHVLEFRRLTESKQTSGKVAEGGEGLRGGQQKGGQATRRKRAHSSQSCCSRRNAGVPNVQTREQTKYKENIF